MSVQVQVKLCGLRTAASARAAREAGADFAGLNFVPTSRRRVDVERAAALAKRLAPVKVVGVFANAPLAEIRAVAQAVGLEWVQLHGQEPEPVVEALAREYAVIKAIPVENGRPITILPGYLRWATALLFDGARPGQGETFTWSSLTQLQVEKPFFLAGGLTPENVGHAIRTVRPFGVDTASGIELDGKENDGRIRAFVSEAKRTLMEHP